MTERHRHAPTRTCIGCGARRPQSELVRFTAPAGTLIDGPGPGRGVYLCPSATCAETALKRRAFPRRLRGDVVVDAARVAEAVNPPAGRIHR